MPDFAGGGEYVVYNIAKGLQKRGHEVHVLTTGDPTVTEYKGIKTTRIKVNRYLMNLMFLKIKEMAKDYDLIQTFSFNAAFPSYVAGKLAKKPVVFINLGVYGKAWKHMAPPLINTIMRLGEKLIMNRKYDRTIFLSEHSRMVGASIGMKIDKSYVINPGVDLTNYKPLKKESFVLFSGRLAGQKGLDLLMAAAKLCPDIKFVLMGQGVLENKLRRMKLENVSFSKLSLKDGKPYFDMYGHAPVLCLPSYGEGFPITIIEAMASGCAIISTIELDYGGLFLPIRKAVDLASMIDVLIRDKRYTAELGKKNIQLSKKYTWKNFIDKLGGVYDGLGK